MVKHYLAVALRGFLSNKLFSFINVFGLAVGLASAILIGLYVADELSYDGFHPDADRVYRLGRDIYPREDFAGLNMATLPSIAAEQLQQDYPEIERIARASTGAGLVGHGAVAFYENDMLYADPALLQILHFDWLVGDPATALDAPTSIVVTESFARKYFGEQAAFGQVLTFENRTEMTVTGMIRDLPANTHLRASALRPLSVLLGVLPEEARTGWGWNIMHTYVRFASGTNVKALSATFPAFMDRHLTPLAGGNKASQASGITAINVRDIHLKSSLQNEMSSPGSMTEVLSLVVIAAGIVLIGCFNFMNLSTAQSALRGKEVGIRKTIGADRRQLIVQFLGESVGMALFAILIAIMLVEITLPAFNGFSGKQLEFDVLNDHAVQAALGLLVMMVGFLSGSYPALYLSAIKPAQVLKNHSGINLRGVVFRNLLVVLQFSISIALVIATTVVVLQMRYVRNFNPGFAKEQVLILNGSPTLGLTTRWNALRAELQHQPGVLDVTASSLVPGTENLNGTAVHLQGLPDSEAFSFSTLLVDYGFFDTYRIEILAGRSFSPDLSGDLLPPVAAESTTENSIERAANFILNAAAARAFGWAPEQAIDQFIETTGTSRVAGRVVGVVADTQFETLHHNIKPLLFLLAEQGQQSVPVFSAASLRLDGRNLPATLAAIDSAWKQVIPEFPMSRRFLSDDFQALYQDDIRLGQLFSSFAGLAILIACLGLFGLATFNAQRRIKEIGVRKVMGGTVWSIVLLLTKDFSKLVLRSNLLAWPVAYFAMERWLQNFAYRIDLTPLIFIGSGLIALCIAWATVGGTAAKAASAKPVLALRYE